MADKTAPDDIVVPVPDPVPAPVAPTVADRITQAVRVWQTTSLTNSPISRDDVCWNHVDGVLPDLIALILKEI